MSNNRNNMNSISKQSTYTRIMGFLKPHWLMGVVGIIGTILYAAIDAGFVYLLEPLLNDGFINPNEVFIKWLPYIVLILFISRSFASFISQYCMTWVARTVVMEMRQQIFEKLLKIPSKVYDKTTSGQLLSKLLYDSEQIAQVSMDSITMFFHSMFLLIGLFIVMLRISVPLTLLYFLTVPFIAIIVISSNKRIRRSSKTVQDSMMSVTDSAEEAIEGYKEVRIFNGGQYESNKFARANFNSRKYDLKVTITKSINVAVVQFIAACGISMIIYLAINPSDISSFKAISAGSFTSMISAMLAMLRPLKLITTINSSIQRGLAGAESIFKLLDSEDEPDHGKNVISNIKGEIKFENVSFCYPETTKKILKGITFTIKPGQTVAIVGKSGSGKTTIASLLPRFYEIKDGKISIDGIDIQDISLKSLRKQFATVSQHITLFNDTIYKNIGYSNINDIDSRRVQKTAKQAHVLEFTDELPNGLETVIGENGVLLSGGQRQRIAIARAIYKNSPILLLDEATSALDTESERIIQDVLDEIMRKRTTLVIAHRLSTVARADLILVLDNGVVVEEGTHKELLGQGVYYKQLYKMQFQDENE